MQEDIVERIKAFEWDNRVSRPGFIQSKLLITEAEMLPVELIPGITCKFNSQLWVNDFNLYEDRVHQSFPDKFKAAFEKDPNWPVSIINFFDVMGKKVKDFSTYMLETNWSAVSKEEKLEAFSRYVAVSKPFQKYYVIAIPLAGFCENHLKEKGQGKLIPHYSFPFKDLEINDMQKSLFILKKLQETKDAEKSEEHLVNHLKQFAWVKTGYNLISEYKREDVLNEIRELKEEKKFGKKPEVSKKIKPFFVGLQVGIYLRNRMKELCLQMWFAVESLGASMAHDIGISRDDFFQLTCAEARASLEKGTCIITIEDLKKRHQNFVVGFLENEEVLLMGKPAKELFDYFNHGVDATLTEIRGNTGCPGHVHGTVKIMKNAQQFKDFKQGDILVTSMTTLDYLVLMKKAGAIVTDEGGLTCHAAIVSRELGIPCIIGTKIATKVFKDGDRVDVDADNGIAKKI